VQQESSGTAGRSWDGCIGEEQDPRDVLPLNVELDRDLMAARNITARARVGDLGVKQGLRLEV